MQAPQSVALEARKQHGLVTSSQLRAAGVTANVTSAWVHSGRLHRIHHGVYAVGHRALSREAWLMAAVLAVAPDAAVSHRSAGRLWGLVRDRVDPRQTPVDVIAPRRARRRRGIRVHFAASLPRRDLTRYAGIPVTRPARTLLDIAAVLPTDALRRAVRQAEVDGLARQGDLDAQLARTPPRYPGVRRLAAIVALGPARTRSELEDRMLALLRRRGFPTPLINARVAGVANTVEVDFLFPDLRLVLETDGDRYHGTRLAREHDAARQADLEAAGYRVVRLNWRQVTAEEEQTVRRLRRIVGDQAPS